MKKELETLLDVIRTDYDNWTAANNLNFVREDLDKFNEGVCYKEGTKYIKILKDGGGTVWGFVVATDKDKKFKKGDILKAAGYNAPARNKARGNILDGDYTVRWTGPLYLK